MKNDEFLIKILLSMIVLLSLGACATTLQVKKALDAETKEQLQVSEVSVTATPTTFMGIAASNASDAILNALKSAVLSQLSSVNPQGKPAIMEIVITRAQIVTQGKRALLGAIAGANLLDITATIKDKETKAILGIYDVKGSYNPGGFGIFSDPVEATTSNVAEELVKGIYQ